MRGVVIILILIAGCASPAPVAAPPADCRALEPVLEAHRRYPASPRHASDELGAARKVLGDDFEPCLAAEARKDPEVARRLTLCLDALAEEDAGLAPAVYRLCLVWIETADAAGEDAKEDLFTAMYVGAILACHQGDMATAKELKRRTQEMLTQDEHFRLCVPASSPEDFDLYDRIAQ